MKKVLFVFLVIMFSFVAANSQNCCNNVLMNFGNLTILPNNYTSNDTIKLVVPFGISSYNLRLWQIIDVDSNQITISNCFWIFPLPGSIPYLDTITLGVLPENNYSLTVNAYCSCDSICSYTDTVSKTIQLDITTNVVRFFNENATLSPNPFSQSTQITLNQSYHSIALAVYDIQGKQVAQQQYTDCDKIQLSRNQLSNGLYFLKLTLDDKAVETGKIVIGER